MTTSAFRLAPLWRLPSEQATLDVVKRQGVSRAEGSQRDKSEDSESEDEEITVTCCGGLRADNEFDSSDDEDESSVADDELQESEKEGLVLFVSERVSIPDSPLVKPTPTAASALSPLFGDMIKGDNQVLKTEPTMCSVKKQMVPVSLRSLFGKTDKEENRDEDQDKSDDDSLNSSSSSMECGEIDNVSKVVSECTDSADAEAMGVDYFALDSSEDDDDELSGILETLRQSSPTATEDETDSSDRIIGVMGDRDDLLTIPKVKRVLSYNTLAELSEEAKLEIFSPKRPRLKSQPSSLLSALALNTASLYRKPAISEDEDDEICSTMIKDELLDYGVDLKKDKRPIPLLTPPSSPLTFPLDGDTATVCEWPYNLVVDSAMTAVCELTPISLTSLEDLELRDADFAELAC